MPLFTKIDFGVVNPILIRDFSQPSAEQTSEILESIDFLPELIGDKNWALGGSIAIQLACGEFYRLPANINISVEVDKIAEIVERANQHKEKRVLLSRGWLVASPNGKSKYETYQLAESKEELLKGRYPNLRLVRFNKRFSFSRELSPVANRGLTDYIDVHLFEVKNYTSEEIRNRLGDFYFSSREKSESKMNISAKLEMQEPLLERTTGRPFFYQTRNGINVRVRGLEYMEYVKKWIILLSDKSPERKRVDWYDLGKIHQARRTELEYALNSLNCNNAFVPKLPSILKCGLDEMANLWNVEPTYFRTIFNKVRKN